jgi:gamma-glutamylcyclotransferase
LGNTLERRSSAGSRCKCDIEATRISTDRVYEVLFSIAEFEAGALDDAEGLGHGYRKGEVQIVTPDGTPKAIAFFATNKNPALLPYDWYKDFVVQGAGTRACATR